MRRTDRTRLLQPPLPALAAALALALAACSLDVDNPGVVDASAIDPVADARTLSLSAQQNFFDVYGDLINASALYSGEVWTGAVRQESNDIGRRAIVDTNLDLNATFWAPLQIVLATNDQVVNVLRDASDFDTNLNVARSSLWAGFALTLLGEFFCQGVIAVGPPLTRAATLDSAAVRFQRAIDVAGTLADPEAVRILHAARVGLARARLQQGDLTNAAATADLVPADFVAHARYVDDAQSRGRTANGVFLTSAGTTQIVAAAYRELDDPRVPFADAGAPAQDGRNRLFRQAKYVGYAAPIRVASHLEARYIAAEARLKLGTPAPALALIAERKAIAGQPGFSPTDADAILAELMSQRARDFWLEARHLGDALRNPLATPFVPTTGSPFYKPEQGDFGPLTCLDVPFVEKANNPNF
jgi:starch-binding outer membrane protein, SusD/RagB family